MVDRNKYSGRGVVLEHGMHEAPSLTGIVNHDD